MLFNNDITESTVLGFFMIKLKFITFLLLFASIFNSCSLEDSGVIDISFQTLKSSNSSISPKNINLDTILVKGGRNASDTLIIKLNAYLKVTSANIIVECNISEQRTTKIVGKGNLLDDGVFPDLIKSDSIYSGSLTITIQRSYYGLLNANFTSFLNNEISDKLITPINISRSNLPPQLSNLIMADSVTLSQTTQTFPITIQSSDPDGLNDISKVEFSSFRLPDTTTVRGNFEMYDDGGKNKVSGNNDSKESDGIYSLTIQLPPSTITGSYLFVFQATDRSNVISNKIKKTILIK